MITELVIDEKPVGGYGYRLVVHRVTDVGCTYRATVISPDGVATHSPTRFRKSKSTRVWALKEIKRLRSNRT